MAAQIWEIVFEAFLLPSLTFYKFVFLSLQEAEEEFVKIF